MRKTESNKCNADLCQHLGFNNKIKKLQTEIGAEKKDDNKEDGEESENKNIKQ